MTILIAGAPPRGAATPPRVDPGRGGPLAPAPPAQRNGNGTCEDVRVGREVGDGLEFDDDPARIDVDAVHDFLANTSYWAQGRSRAVVERLIQNAQRVVGIYDAGRQVGFARAFTDGATLAYLADVYVLEDYRGRGLGVELVREMIDNGPYAHLSWILHTRDAHGLYRKFGFAEPSERVLERTHS